jgi:hypothetical protein
VRCVALVYLFICCIPILAQGESATSVLDALKAKQTFDRQAAEICSSLKTNPNCRKSLGQMQSLTGLTVGGCQAQKNAAGCKKFIEKFPEYKSKQMNCEPYEVCKQAMASTHAEGCKRYGIEMKDSFLGAIHKEDVCLGNPQCGFHQFISALKVLANPSQALLQYEIKTSSQIVRSFIADKKKLENMACLDAETQAQFECYLEVQYEGGFIMNALGAEGAAQMMLRMAALDKALLQVEAAAPRAVAASADSTTALRAPIMEEQPYRDSKFLNEKLGAHSDIYTEAKALNDSQIEFLESLGAELKGGKMVFPHPDRMIRTLDTRVDDLIRLGKIAKREALHPARVFRNSDGHLIAVRIDVEIPEGYFPFEGTIPDRDFAKFLSSGLFPIGEVGVTANAGQSLFLHDLSHMGSYMRDFKLMAAARDTHRYIAAIGFERYPDIVERMNFANEYTSTAFVEKRSNVVNYMHDLKAIPSGSPPVGRVVRAFNASEYAAVLKGKTEAQINTIITHLSEHYHEYINNAGGAAHDIPMREVAKQHGYRRVAEEYGWMESVQGLASQLNLTESLGDKVTRLSRLLSALDYTSQITPSEWVLESSTHGPMPKTSKVYEYVCESGAFAASTKAYQVYCK